MEGYYSVYLVRMAARTFCVKVVDDLELKDILSSVGVYGVEGTSRLDFPSGHTTLLIQFVELDFVPSEEEPLSMALYELYVPRYSTTSGIREVIEEMERILNIKLEFYEAKPLPY